MGKSGLIIGGFGHYWYKFLDNKFPGTARSTILKKLACEMAVGQLICFNFHLSFFESLNSLDFLISSIF